VLELGDGDPMHGGVQLPIAATVEPVTDSIAGPDGP
jgi:hypothetical protein